MMVSTVFSRVASLASSVVHSTPSEQTFMISDNVRCCCWFGIICYL